MNKIMIAVTLAGLSAIVAGTYAKAPPKQVVLDKCKKKKAGVAFDHAKHTKQLKIKCKTCHHTGKHESCAAAKCHAGKAEGKRPGCAEMSMKKNPYHISCAGCHKKMKKGPKKCKACHK